MKDKALKVSLGGGQKAERASNLELFRIITMLLIVAHHYVVNSGLTAADGPVYAEPLSWRSLFLLVFGAYGKTGINCFVLISGYFMCKSQITAKKFCKLLFLIEFYKIGIWLVFLLTGYADFSLAEFIKLFLPIRTISNGFSSAYLVFFLIIPFLNILIRGMNEKYHVMLLLLCSFVYIVLGTLPGFSVTMNYFSWFIVLYFIGAYIRLYEKTLFQNTRFWGWCTVAMLLVSVASVVGMAWIGEIRNKRIAHFLLNDCNKAVAVALSISAFLFFKNLKIKNSKIINTVAASTFGVLLIHANSDTMRRWLWVDTLDNVGMYNSPWLVPHAIGCVLLIYVVCTAIDYLRIRFIEKPFFRFWDNHWGLVKAKYLGIEKKLCEKLKIQD